MSKFIMILIMFGIFLGAYMITKDDTIISLVFLSFGALLANFPDKITIQYSSSFPWIIIREE